jgi:addiction module HigA family antidote
MGKLQIPHPGETIREDCLKPFGMSVTALAKNLKITPARLNEIVTGRRGITADTALRLGRYFGTTPKFWLSLQAAYDLDVARRDAGARIAKEIKPRKEAA